MGELAYMVPVKELTGTVTFRHLLRFSQKGNSFCLLLVMCVPMHLRSKVSRQGVNGRDAGEISELAQIVWLLALVTLPTLGRRRRYNWCCAVRSTINCISCRHQA